jgi:phosphatidylinositol 4-kinase
MGGIESSLFQKFRDVIVKTFMTLRRHHDSLILVLEMFAKGNEHLDCFGTDAAKVIDDVRNRFYPTLNDNAAVEKVQWLVNSSIDNWSTSCYDRYQKCCVGIF